MDDWINKAWYLHTIESYSAPKKKKIYPYTTKWKNLEDIILSKKQKKVSHRSTIYIFTSKVPIIEGQNLKFPAQMYSPVNFSNNKG